MRQIDCRVYYHYNGGHPRRRLYLTQLIDDGNFGRKRKKPGDRRPPREKGRGEKQERERERETRKESAVTPTGLLVSNVIYLPCTRIKNLHYCATMRHRGRGGGLRRLRRRRGKTEKEREGDDENKRERRVRAKGRRGSRARGDR
ncbi:hypothetical protein PUN28_000680 [Cardiocondyla obscurior]|uniref:Uncharacterized protein n=1 Tax=Cardiocondyla obscurior TaxID=286306 RepID=A0AAW2H115_9HYME